MEKMDNMHGEMLNFNCEIRIIRRKLVCYKWKHSKSDEEWLCINSQVNIIKEAIRKHDRLMQNAQDITKLKEWREKI